MRNRQGNGDLHCQTACVLFLRSLKIYNSSYFKKTDDDVYPILLNSPNSTEVSTKRANSAVQVPVLPTGSTSTTFFSYRYVEYISKLTVYFKLTASAVGFWA